MRIWGTRGQPRVVLLHALGCHGGWWDWVGSRLAERGYCVTVPDLRGHGDAAWADSYRFADYAADVALLADGACGVVGHSMGGYVGLVLAALGAVKPPAKFLVADMKTSAPPDELAALQAAAAKPGRVHATLAEAVARYRLAPPGHRVPVDRLATVAAGCFRQQPDGTWVEKFDRRALAIEPLEPVGLVRQVRCPVRFVRGELSPLMPAAAAEALAREAGAALVTMPGLCHHLPLEDPDGLAAVVAEFLGK
jgi:pimeloyl-ACP methyl ester carboxylesterase